MRRLIFTTLLSAGLLANAQGFTVNLPPDAFMIKLNKGLTTSMAINIPKAQGPGQCAIVAAV